MKRKILTVLGVLLFVLIAVIFFSIQSAQNEPPPEILANFTNLDKIEKISKYRSCAGHVTVPQDEREVRRNMKHYFWVKPEFNKVSEVEIYSPYDGYVTDIRDEPELNLEGEIWIRAKSNLVFLPPLRVWQFSVQHIDIRKDLKRGSEVKAGELLGYAALSEKRGNSFDIVYGKMGIPTKKIDNWTDPFADLDSVFNHMQDQVFSQYQKKGIVSKQDLIISKETRDKNLCEYQGEGPYFNNQFSEDNWVKI